MRVVPYSPDIRDAFVSLNLAWIEELFRVEEDDVRVLYGVDSVVAEGGMVFSAVDGGEVLSTGMIRPLGGGEWELCKLATRPDHRRRGCATQVVRACLDYAAGHGGRKAVIISRTRLPQALSLYRALGFREVPLDRGRWGYERVDIQLELPLTPSDGRSRAGTEGQRR